MSAVRTREVWGQVAVVDTSCVPPQFFLASPVFPQHSGDHLCVGFHWPHIDVALNDLGSYQHYTPLPSCLGTPLLMLSHGVPHSLSGCTSTYNSEMCSTHRLNFWHWHTDADGLIFSLLHSSQMDCPEASSCGFLENSPRRSSNQLQMKRWLILLLVLLSSLPHSPVPYFLLRTAHPSR